MEKGKTLIITDMVNGKKISHLLDISAVRHVQVEEGKGIVLVYEHGETSILGDPIQLLYAINPDWAGMVSKDWEKVDK